MHVRLVDMPTPHGQARPGPDTRDTFSHCLGQQVIIVCMQITHGPTDGLNRIRERERERERDGQWIVLWLTADRQHTCMSIFMCSATSAPSSRKLRGYIACVARAQCRWRCVTTQDTSNWTSVCLSTVCLSRDCAVWVPNWPNCFGFLYRWLAVQKTEAVWSIWNPHSIILRLSTLVFNLA